MHGKKKIKWILGMCAGVVVIFLLLGITSFFSRVKKEEMKKENSVRNEWLQAYPYANSTDVYSINDRYALDGTKRIMLPGCMRANGFETDIAYVSDKWLYYYEFDDEENGMLRRIPLHKGEDNRDIIDLENMECVRDTKNENSFTVNGEYYAGISYGTVAMLWNMETGQIIRQKIPEEIAYPKKVMTEDKYWYVLAQSDNWILWGGEYGAMLQMIPSGQLQILERKAVIMAVHGRDYLYYATDQKKCYKYNLNTREKKLWLNEEQLQDIVRNKLNLTKETIISCNLDCFFSDDKKIYWQLRVKLSRGDESEKKYVVLSQSLNSDELPVYDGALTDILQKNGASGYFMHVGPYWYLQKESYYCYNQEKREIKEITENDPEWNIAYALSPWGVEENNLMGETLLW